ncbi:MAG: hypothetical protein ABI707_17520 [Ferruginibacter sp.]
MKTKLCFPYYPGIISIGEIVALAKRTGVKITEAFAHLLIEVSGIRH